MKKTNQRLSRQYWNDSTFAENTQEPDFNLVDLATAHADDNIRIDPITTDFSEQDPIDRLLVNTGFDDISTNNQADTIISDKHLTARHPDSMVVQEKTTADMNTKDFALETFIADCLNTRNSELNDSKQSSLIVESILIEGEPAPEQFINVHAESLTVVDSGRLDTSRAENADIQDSASQQNQDNDESRQAQSVTLMFELQELMEQHSAAISQQLKRLHIALVVIVLMLCGALFCLGILYNQQNQLKSEVAVQKQWLELIKDDLTSLTFDKEP